MSFYGGFKAFIEWVAVHYVRVFGKIPDYTSRDLKTPRGWLQLLDVICNLLAIGFFSKIAWLEWQRVACPRYISLKEGIACFGQAVLPCAMVAVIGSVFFLSRRSAKTDLSRSEKLFPQGLLPAQWIIPTAPVKIAFSVILFLFFYMAIAWYTDKIAVVSAFMFGIACIDLNTLRWIRKHVEIYFSSPEYAPIEGERDYELILRRRKIIREYFYTNPQPWKEAGRIAGCAIALLVALRGHRTSAYLVLLSTLIVNEIVTARWRARRDRAWFTLPGPVPPNRVGKAGVP